MMHAILTTTSVETVRDMPDAATLDPAAVGLAFQIVPSAFDKTRRSLTTGIRSTAYEPTLLRIRQETNVSESMAAACAQHVLRRLQAGTLEAWVDLLKCIPAGWFRALDVRPKGSKARRLGKIADEFVPFERCSPLYDGAPIRFHARTGGWLLRKGATTDAALMLWYGSDRGALILQRINAANVLLPRESTVRTIVDQGKDYRLP